MCGYRIAGLSVSCLALSWVLACSDDSPGTGQGPDGDTTLLDAPMLDVNLDGLVPPPDGEAEDSADPSGDAPDAADRGDAVEDRLDEIAHRFEECGPSGPICESPLVCLGTCQWPCSAGCPQDEVCIEFEQFPGVGICGVLVGAGESCDADLARFCEEGFYCDPEDGVCRQEGVVGEGDACNRSDAFCGEGLVCIYWSWDEGFCHATCNEDPLSCGEGEVCLSSMFSGNVCYEDCDPTTDPECSSEYYLCQEPLGGGESACLPRQGPPPGDQEYGEACDDENTCVEGLLCTPVLPGAYCTQSCRGGTPCPTDPPGASCIIGYCLFTCPGGETECPEGMVCEQFFGQALCHWL